MSKRNPSLQAIRYLLQKKGSIELPASGTSMYPLIKEGDICGFVGIDEVKNLREGDIVLFLTSTENLVVHRFLYRIKNSRDYEYYFKGDTNALPDSPVTEAQLIGKLFVIRKQHFSLKSESLIPQVWKMLILCMPRLPIYLKHYSTRPIEVHRDKGSNHA